MSIQFDELPQTEHSRVTTTQIKTENIWSSLMTFLSPSFLEVTSISICKTMD